MGVGNDQSVRADVEAGAAASGALDGHHRLLERGQRLFLR